MVRSLDAGVGGMDCELRPGDERGRCSGSDDRPEATANVCSLVASGRLQALDRQACFKEVIRFMPYWPRNRPRPQLRQLSWVYPRRVFRHRLRERLLHTWRSQQPH